MFGKPRAAANLAAAISPFIVSFILSGAALGAAPPIRLSATNQVPACVTPAALNQFLADQSRQRKHQLSPRFRDIAHHYQRHGLTHRVRWDYAFFQMALETNFLSFRRANGKRGDVHPRQNNFAGLGTTGGGVPGDSYPNPSTGVLAQIQHLVVYSGERLANPVGHRTRLKQNVILQSIAPVVRKRPVTFSDLARRWAADRRYGRSIQRLAGLFYKDYCRPPSQTANQTVISDQHTTARARQSPVPLPLRPRPAKLVASPASKPNRPTKSTKAPQPLKTCQVQVASYGGSSTVLIQSEVNGAVKLTALTVQPGFEAAMAANFIQSYAPQGRNIGAYASSKNALAKAHSICSARRVQASK